MNPLMKRLAGRAANEIVETVRFVAGASSTRTSTADEPRSTKVRPLIGLRIRTTWRVPERASGNDNVASGVGTVAAPGAVAAPKRIEAPSRVSLSSAAAGNGRMPLGRWPSQTLTRNV